MGYVVLHVLMILSVILIFVPSIVFFTIYVLLYRSGRKYVEPSSNLYDRITSKVSIIVPIRKEPIEYIDELLRMISSWSISGDVEVFIVSDDPREGYPLLEKTVSKWRSNGLNAFLVWRSEPRGYKSGALNTGLWISKGKYVLVLDVDSRVDEEFITKSYSIMERDPEVVAVVGRWIGKNRDTRVSEALYTSMKFVVDSLYKGRSALGLPVFPLGSGTMYRSSFLKKVLRGWDEERIQDDLEIGCRIMGLNKKILFLDKNPVYVEVPRRYRSLRTQQDRWVYGATDVAITRFKHLIKSKQPWYAKFDALYYLLQYFPAISSFIGFLILSAISIIHPVDYMAVYWYMGVFWAALATLYSRYYVVSLREHGYGLWRSIVNLGRSSAITVSLTPVFTKSFFQALFRVKTGFKRTPKGRYEHVLSRLRFPVETLIGIYSLLLGCILLMNQILFTGGWFITYSLGYLYATMRWWRDIFYK